jgi:hypothetical protein
MDPSWIGMRCLGSDYDTADVLWLETFRQIVTRGGDATIAADEADKAVTRFSARIRFAASEAGE